MSYSPSNVPRMPGAGFLTRELRRIADCFLRIDNLKLGALSSPPQRVEDGMVVYADGVNWNPGSGAGFYGREQGAWVKL